MTLQHAAGKLTSCFGVTVQTRVNAGFLWLLSFAGYAPVDRLRSWKLRRVREGARSLSIWS